MLLTYDSVPATSRNGRPDEKPNRNIVHAAGWANAFQTEGFFGVAPVIRWPRFVEGHLIPEEARRSGQGADPTHSRSEWPRRGFVMRLPSTSAPCHWQWDARVRRA